MMLSSGDTPKTTSGRTCSAFPKVDTSTYRKSQNTLNRVGRWLWENAVEEATSRGDDFNRFQFEKAADPKSLTQAEKDSMHLYLFGEIF